MLHAFAAMVVLGTCCLMGAVFPAKATTKHYVVYAKKPATGWRLTLRRYKGSHRFYSCTVSTGWPILKHGRRNGDVAHLFMLMNGKGQFLIAVSNTGWDISKGASYRVSLSFDGKPGTDGYARGIGASMIRMGMPKIDIVGHHIAKAKKMTVWFNGRKRLRLDLKGSAKVIDALKRCYERNSRPKFAPAPVSPPTTKFRPKPLVPPVPNKPRAIRPVHSDGGWQI